MAYNKQTWKDEIPDLTKPIKDAFGKQKMDPQTGRPLYELVQEGTRITSARLNHAEQGIEDAHILIEQLAKEWGGSFVAASNGTAGFQFTASGLTASWTAGVGYVAGRRFEVAAGSLTLNPTQGQYIYLDTDGVVKRTTSQATANADLLLWYLATDASKVITSTDRRRTITPDSFVRRDEVVLKEPGKGLSTNDYSNEEKAKVQEHRERLQDHDQRLTVIEDEMGEAAPIPATLKPGIQTITADRTTPFNISSIKGRTLVNLLGRDGNCEDVSKWRVNPNATVTLDSQNADTGKSCFKTVVNTGHTDGSFYKEVKIKPNSYYIGVARVKNVNATQVRILFDFQPTSIVYSQPSTGKNKYETIFAKVKPSDYANASVAYLNLAVEGSAGQYAYADAISVYEITAAEYAALDSMTPEQIADKYPYVDDVKPVRNPYAIRYGKNLLPPFTDWTLGQFNTINGAYDLTILNYSDTRGYAARIVLPVLEEETYTFSCYRTGRITITANDHNGYNEEVQQTVVFDDATNKAGEMSCSFTIPKGKTHVRIMLSREGISSTAPGKDGTYNYKNPMLNIGDTALPFELQNNDYVFYDTALHSNVDGTVRDELFYRDGQPRKLEKFREVVLDGNFISKLTFISATKENGYKSIRWSTNGLINAATLIGLNMCTKYDGTILKPWQSTEVPDQIWTNGPSTEFYLTIPNKDSGWGENYTPSEDEIKAYFNGWKMYDNVEHANPYLGTGGRAWVKLSKMVNGKFVGIGDGVDATNTLPTSLADGGYTPYRLIYPLAQPVEVPVTSEGKITLHEGTNVLEVGTGVAIRESVKPALSDTGKHYQLNNKLYTGNLFQYRTDTILRVYRNIDIDSRWMKFSDANSNGKEHAYITTENYNTNAAYSVTYLVLDRHAFTAPLIDLQGEYAKTVAGVLALEAKNAADVETRVSVATMLLDKILRGEISMGTDWSKQIPKGFNYHYNNMLSGTETEILNIKGKGYLTSISMNPDSRYTVNFGVYIDGKMIVSEANMSLGSSAVTSFTPLYRFNNSLVIKVRNNDTESRSIALRIAYTLDS
ncbi:hypothetical protein AM501_15050 [Aneurinibacillus migulanus]|uniref:hypothetical protein n=1 Tax=Aneurinibacillus migulanus TaxID=47500 RepID=UPI0005BE98AB|nr:hypothetical protein [Aneurinibacillus migulanus]KIV59517.1 hypothetical protein TS64_02240 [Aneurinibacillus migulanus]KPD07554.1 hypothetical protein AM501_15050 [Aneurinibacillus migulanus]